MAAGLARFGRRLLWLAPLLAAALVAFNVWAIRLGLPATPQLANIAYQIERVAAADRVETVLLGDSSLGHLFDSRTWERLAGEPALSLALTGAEGYAGDLAMLQHVLARHRPRRVVLVHTPDMPTRSVAWQAFLVMRPDAPSISLPPVRWLREQHRVHVSGEVLFSSLKGAVRKLVGLPPPFLRDGYVHGRTPLAVERRFAVEEPLRLDPAEIDPEKALFLELIVDRCAAAGLDCRYAFGPVWDAVCASSSDYLAAARTWIEEIGMPVVAGTPICVLLDHLDDTIDHVLPAVRARYTAELHTLLTAARQTPGARSTR
jgi:hypothetical protein